MFKIVPSTLNIIIFMPTCHLNSVSHLFLLLFLFIFFLHFFHFFSFLPFLPLSVLLSAYYRLVLSQLADSDLHHLKSGRGCLCVTCLFALLLSRCFTSTEIVWLIRDGGRVGSGTRTQAHLPVHTAPELGACPLMMM